MSDKSDIEYMEARSRMESAIGEFYKKALEADIDEDYIVEDITEAVCNATDGEIILEEEV